jgi:hypothetical protein
MASAAVSRKRVASTLDEEGGVAALADLRWTLRDDASAVMRRVEAISERIRAANSFWYNTVWRIVDLPDTLGFNPGYQGATGTLPLDDWSQTLLALVAKVWNGGYGSYELCVLSQAIVEEGLLNCRTLQSGSKNCPCPRCRAVALLCTQAETHKQDGVRRASLELARKIVHFGAFVADDRLLIRDVRDLTEHNDMARQMYDRINRIDSVVPINVSLW